MNRAQSAMTRLRRVVLTMTMVGATCAIGVGPLVLCASPASAATCTPTGFIRDHINLTAAEINPTTTVTSTVDPTDCNIGVYFGSGSWGAVDHALVENANYYGIVNNGGNVSVTNSTINNIGETPLNGDQHGVRIHFALEGNSVGAISGNTVSNYQKGGIVVTGVGSAPTITDNVITGLGPGGFIAQNGIEVGFGAQLSTQQLMRNTVSSTVYTQGAATVYGSTGILLNPATPSGFDHANPTAVVQQNNAVAMNQANVTYVS